MSAIQRPDLQALLEEDGKRINALPLSEATKLDLLTTYRQWLQILWAEGAKQRSGLGAPISIDLTVRRGEDIGRALELQFRFGPKHPFGEVWVEAITGEPPRVLYRFNGFGYATDAAQAF